MLPKFSFILIFVFFLLTLKGAFASRTGINLGTNYGSLDVQTAVNTVGSGGWVVVIANPGDCEKLNIVFSITDPANVNVIIRGHSNNQLYASDAPAWIATLGKLSNTKKAYFMPWNEPNQQGSADAPQNGPSQVVDYTTALLQEAGNAGIRQSKFYFLSPMLNHTWIATYTLFFDALGGLSYFSNFDGVAMNLYDIDTADGSCSPLEEYNPLCAIDSHHNPSKAPSLVSGLKVYGVESGPGPGVPDRRFFYFTDFGKGYNAKFVDRFKGDGNSVMFAIPSYALAGETGWKLYSDSSDAVAIMDGQGGGVENVSFNQAVFDTWLNAKSSSLKSCGSCGYEPATSPGLCSGVGGGTTGEVNACEVPRTQLAKPSCEVVIIDKTVGFSEFGSIDPCSNITATQVVPAIGLLPPMWSIGCTANASYTFDPSRDYYFFKDFYETYIVWDNPTRSQGDNPPTWVARQFSGAPPFSRSRISDTKDADGKYHLEEQGGMWGLLSYLLPPSINTYYDQVFWDHSAQTGMLYETAKILLPKVIPPATTVDASLSGTAGIFVGGDLIDATPYTQSTLGGVRLEQHIEPLAYFSAQKVACSIMGRPGQTDCGPETSIYDFKNYIATSEAKYKNFALGDLVVRDSTSSSCTNPVVENTKETPRSTLLASAVPIPSDSALAQSSQSSGQVLSAVSGSGGCHAGDTVSEEEVKCPHDDAQGKAKVGLSGTITKPTSCSTLISAPTEGLAKAIVGANPTPQSPLWGCDPITISSGIKQSTLPMWEWPTMNAWNNVVRAVFQSPTKRYWEGRPSEAGWNVGGSSTIAVSSNNRRTVEDGTTTGCMYTGAVAGVSRPGEAVQPDPNCFEPPETPIPTTTACGTGAILWTNTTGVDKIPLPTGDPVTLCGTLTPIDPVSLNLARNPCHGIRGITMPDYKITIEFNGTSQTYGFSPQAIDPVIYSIKVPNGAKITLSVAGGDWDDQKTTFTAALGQECHNKYVFNQPNHYCNADRTDCTDTQEFCGVQDSCRKYGDRHLNNIPDSNCKNALKYNDDCYDKPTGKIGLACAGQYWACYYHGADQPNILDFQQCSSCPSVDLKDKINPNKVDLEDIDCSGNTCIAVGSDVVKDTGEKGYIYRSSDYGVTWNASFRSAFLFRVSFQNNTEVFVSGRYGFVGYSSNGGTTFFNQPIEDPTAVYLIGLKAYGNTGAYLGASSGSHIWKTENDGDNWNTLDSEGAIMRGTTSDFAVSPDGETVVAASGPGAFWFKKPGNPWTSVSLGGLCGSYTLMQRVRFAPTPITYKDFVLVAESIKDRFNESKNVGCIVKCREGTTGSPSCSGVNEIKFPADFVEKGKPGLIGLDYYPQGGGQGKGILVAVGRKGTIMRSTDGGGIWVSIPATDQNGSPVTADLRAVRILDENIALVVGGKGTILRTTSLNKGLVTWTKLEAKQLDLVGESW